jgi:hypothetical protein
MIIIIKHVCNIIKRNFVIVSLSIMNIIWFSKYVFSSKRLTPAQLSCFITSLATVNPNYVLGICPFSFLNNYYTQ